MKPKGQGRAKKKKTCGVPWTFFFMIIIMLIFFKEINYSLMYNKREGKKKAQSNRVVCGGLFLMISMVPTKKKKNDKYGKK